MSDEEVAEIVDDLKQRWVVAPYTREVKFTNTETGETFTRIEQGSDNPKAEEYIEALGEDRYWEIMTERVRIQYTTAKWRESHTSQLPLKNKYTN